MSALLSCLLLVGCGKSDETDLTIPLQSEPIYFVVGDSEVFEMYVPASCELAYTDNSTYYEFTDGTKIMETYSPVHVTEHFDSDLGVYYSGTGASRDVGSGCITVRCDESVAANFKLLLSDGTEKPASYVMLSQSNVLKLDDNYQDMSDSMHITANGNYMPENELTSVNGQYTADLVANGNSWCKCWIQDGVYVDICNITNTYITCLGQGALNCKGYVSPEQDIVYIEAPTGIFAAKQLHYNSWVVYYASIDYTDYVRTALNVVHAK